MLFKWDETHRKCLIGGIAGGNGGKDFSFVFKRDKNGRLDPEGQYCDKKIVKLNVKFENEGRFGLGCAKVVKINNNPQGLPSGVIMKPFDYSGNVLISIADYKKKQHLEFRRIASLSTRTTLWYIKRADEGLYQNDPVDKLAGIAGKKKEYFKIAGILTLGDLCDFPQDQMSTVEKIPEKSMTAFQKLAREQVIREDSTKDIDYRKCPNPYEAKFGPTWEDQFKKSGGMGPTIVITDFVQHMMEETAAAFKGSAHEDTWLIFHDALSLMRAKDCKEWMAERGYLKRWILPSDDLYQGYPDLQKSY